MFRGGAWFTASYALPQLFTAITSIIAARFLGKADFGQQSFIALNSILIATVISSPLYVAVMRYVGETMGAGRPRLLRSLLGWAWRVSGVTAAVAALILIGVAAAGAQPPGAWAIAGLVAGLSILHTVPTAILVGLQRIRQASMVGLTTGFVGTIGTALVLWAGGGITGMFAVELVIGIVNLAWTGTLARRSVPSPDPDAMAEARELQRRVAHYALVAALGVLVEQIVASRVEFYFLKAFSTTGAIALYTISFSMIVALRLVPSAFGNAVAPAFATLFGADRHDRIRSGFTRAVRLTLVLTLPLSVAAFVLGPQLVRLLYGPQYTGVSSPLRVLLTVFPLIALSSLSDAYLAGVGRVRVPLAANTVAAVVDVGLALLLVPALDASGAAAANAAGQATYALIVLVVVVRALGPSGWHAASLVRSVGAAAAAGAAGWVVLAAVDGLGGLLLGGAAFAAVYGICAVGMHVLRTDDAMWLEGALGGRGGRRAGRVARAMAAG